MDIVKVSLNQQQMDALTDLIDKAVKHPTLGGLAVMDQASMIMSLLRMSVMQKQLAEQAPAAQPDPTAIPEPAPEIAA